MNLEKSVKLQIRAELYLVCCLLSEVISCSKAGNFKIMLNWSWFLVLGSWFCILVSNICYLLSVVCYLLSVICCLLSEV
jgi:hypothetical protein